MGVLLGKMTEITCNSIVQEHFTAVENFEFHDPFIIHEIDNGRVFNDIYIPDEIIVHILSYCEPRQLLSLSLVCKTWCNIVKSNLLWMHIYKRKHCLTHAKNLPWYIYYNYFTTDNFTNLIRNGNGEKEFKNWLILKNYGDQFAIEATPVGAELLPEDVPEFHGHRSCFATSFYECSKVQVINLEKKRLLRYILNQFKPHIYVSEWTTGRFDCGSIYKMTFKALKLDVNELIDMEDPNIRDLENLMNQHDELGNKEVIHNNRINVVDAGKKVFVHWTKIEMHIREYPQGLKTLIFGHEGHDTQFWKGHYGSKMAGGVVKFSFDSISL